MTGKSATMSTLRSESCHSSYDNLDFASDYDDYGENWSRDRVFTCRDLGAFRLRAERPARTTCAFGAETSRATFDNFSTAVAAVAAAVAT